MLDDRRVYIVVKQLWDTRSYEIREKARWNM